MPRFRIFYSLTGIVQEPVTIPANVPVLTATPNPFTTGTAISMQPAAGSDARVRIFDASGCLVRTFSQSSIDNRQSSIVCWDGRDAAGRRVQPGEYFCRLSHGGTARLIRID
jgi:flagellar hook assembly protein FlgD